MITTFADGDCQFQIPGELGEITRLIRADVDNEPKINIERVFQRFHQGEDPSTILRCDMVTGGLFTTWWVQSLESRQAALDLFEGFIRATSPAIRDNNTNETACADIRTDYGEMAIRYSMFFEDRGICSGATFNGYSGLIWFRNNVIGIDSPFYRELFDLIAFHAEAVIDNKSK